MKRAAMFLLLVLLGFMGWSIPAPGYTETQFRGMGEIATIDQGDKYAIIIGINSYNVIDSQLPPLNYAVNDAMLIKQALIRYADFSEDNIFIKLDAHATKGQIYQQVQTVNALANHSKDMVLFYFSGHGFTHGGINYICPFNAEGDNPDKAISVPDIRSNLAPDVKRKIFIIDACRNNTKSAGLGTLDPTLLEEAEGQGMLLSAAAGQYAQENSNLTMEDLETGQRTVGHGLFTYHLVNALKGPEEAMVEVDGYYYLTVDSIGSYVREKVTRETADTFVQTPVVILDSTYDIPFAKVKPVPQPVEEQRETVVEKPYSEPEPVIEEPEIPEPPDPYIHPLRGWGILSFSSGLGMVGFGIGMTKLSITKETTMNSLYSEYETLYNQGIETDDDWNAVNSKYQEVEEARSSARAVRVFSYALYGLAGVGIVAGISMIAKKEPNPEARISFGMAPIQGGGMGFVGFRF